MAPPEARPLRFSKMHGAGNDFVVLDLRADAPLAAALAQGAPDFCRALADRHRGIGYDQLLTIAAPRSAGAVASYGIWNSDGSASRQCGNGARCVAAWLVRDGAARPPTFVLDSPAGVHQVACLGEDRYRVAMGVPQFSPEAVPMVGVDAGQDTHVVRDDAGTFHFGAVSIGNPHAVIEVAAVAEAPVARLGPRLQADPRFPQSANIGFVEIVDRGRVRLRVYERGAGETLACGSGACAAAAVLMRRGRIDRSAVVSLPGGDLQIEWPQDDAQILMSGPAAFVFDGEWLGPLPH